jgi:hypothetical protein
MAGGGGAGGAGAPGGGGGGSGSGAPGAGGGGTGAPGPQMDAFALDVRDLMARTVANLYSHLITRPTGRAVRLAIESQLAELERPALSLVDFSSVRILDYSCADEVVARLLLALREAGEEARWWVLFRGVGEFHRDPIEAVLERHGLLAVLEDEGGRGELAGPAPGAERRLWEEVEEMGRVEAAAIPDLLYRDASDEDRLLALVRRRVLYRHPLRGDLLSLSALSRKLQPSDPNAGERAPDEPQP